MSRRLGMDPRLRGANASNAWEMGKDKEQASTTEAASRMLRVWLSSGGSVVPMFSNDAEEGEFVESLGLFNETLRLVDAVRLRRLTKLLGAGAATKAAELVSASAAQTLAERTTGTRALHHHFATLGRPVDTRNA